MNETNQETGIACDDCGKPTANETTCPYSEDINGVIIECNLCEDCYRERAMDI